MQCVPYEAVHEKRAVAPLHEHLAPLLDQIDIADNLQTEVDESINRSDME